MERLFAQADSNTDPGTSSTPTQTSTGETGTEGSSPNVPTPTSAETTAPAPSGITEPEPEPIIVQNTDSTVPLVPPSTPEGSWASYLPIVLGVLALGLGSYILARVNKDKKGEGEDKKCLNWKRLMEEKLNELTDLKAMLGDFAKEKTVAQIRKETKDKDAKKILDMAEAAEREYGRLKKLYEECIALPTAKVKRNIFIFHGTEGYPEENWFPWLKGELEKMGHKVIVPQSPSPAGVPAQINEWWKVLDNYGEYFDENTILIGHSLGGVFALRILENLSYPIKAVVLTGTPTGLQPILNYERDKSFSGFDFDWPAIRKNSKNFIVFHSDNDPYVGLENGRWLASNLGTELSLVPNAGHFNKKAGYTKFEELLEKLKTIL